MRRFPLIPEGTAFLRRGLDSLLETCLQFVLCFQETRVRLRHLPKECPPRVAAKTRRRMSRPTDARAVSAIIGFPSDVPNRERSMTSDDLDESRSRASG